MSYKPGQKRGAAGTDLGGQFIGPKSIARALIRQLQSAGHKDAAEHLRSHPPALRIPSRAISRWSPPGGGSGKAAKKLGSPGAHVAAMQGGAPDAHESLSSDPAIREVQAENRVRQAYRDLRGGRGDGLDAWVGLADLRGQLGDLSRGEQDAALTKMLVGADYNDPGRVRIIPVANTKALKPADRAAALSIGGEDNHAISFGDSSPRPLPGGASQGGAPSTPTAHEPLSHDPATRATQVDNRVRSAYSAVHARQGGDWVGIADLRGEMGDDIPRHEVDASLKRLEQADGVNVVPESNQKTLTQADRDAAVVIGDQPKHAITMDDAATRPVPTGTSGGAPSAPAPAKGTPRRVADLRPGDRILVRQMRDGTWIPAKSNRGAGVTPVTLTRIGQDEYIPQGRQTLRGTGPDGSEIHVLQSTGDRNASHGIHPSESVLAVSDQSPEVSAAPKPAAPKSAAAKMARAKAPAEPPEQTRAKLAAATTREEAHAVLDKMTVKQLKEVDPTSGRAARNRQDLVDAIVDSTVGSRLDSAAIGSMIRTGQNWRHSEHTPSVADVPDSPAVHMPIQQAAHDVPTLAEPTTPAPARKTAAAKMTRGKATAEPPEATHARLAAATSREEARSMLSGMTVAQLKALNPSAGKMAKNKADLIGLIVDASVGYRIDDAAIGAMAPLRRPPSGA